MIVLIVAAITLLQMGAGAMASASASMDLLARAADPNPDLRSYVATADLAATLQGPIPVHKSFHGVVYYLKPRRKIVFDNVSGPLSRFRELTSTTPSYEGLLSTYTVTPLQDDGTTSMYLLVPKKSGSRVSSITVTIDDTTALALRILWRYSNGGELTAEQKYTTLEHVQLIDTEHISARFPGYNVDGVLRFSDYRVNATVDPSVFSST